MMDDTLSQTPNSGQVDEVNLDLNGISGEQKKLDDTKRYIASEQEILDAKIDKFHRDKLKNEELHTKNVRVSWWKCSGRQRWDRSVNFFAHILITTLIPFLPLSYTYFQNDSVEPSGLALTLVIYVLTIALASRELGFFLLGIVSAIFFMPLYGQLVAAIDISAVPNGEAMLRWLKLLAGIMTISNILIGINDHILDSQPALGIQR